MRILPNVLVLPILFAIGCDDDSTKPTPPATVKPPPRVPSNPDVGPGPGPGPVNPGPGPGNTALTPVFTLTDKIVNPESVTHVGDHLYISQMRKGPMDTTGQGVISRVNLDGKEFVESFATGFNAPKGMRASGETLWVADLNRLVPVNIADGKVGDAIEVEPIENVAAGKILLNDVAIDKDGNVYVSDTFGNRIFILKKDRRNELAVVEELFADKDIDWKMPNGLLIEGEFLYVASWGTPKDPATFIKDFAASPGDVVQVKLATGEVSQVKQLKGNLDGIESDGNDGYLVTDWSNGTVERVSKDAREAAVDPLPTGMGSADLAYVAAKKLLVIPVTPANKVVAIELKN